MAKMKGENSMNELLLLSYVYISKEDFINEIEIPNHHFELGGNDDQLWLISNETDKCIIRIDLILKDSNGNIIEDEIDYELYEGTNAPYKGYMYPIEYRDTKIIDEFLKQIIKDDRYLHVAFDDSNEFERL